MASGRWSGPVQGLAGSPGTDPPHVLVAPRTKGSARLAGGLVGRRFHLRRQRRLPGCLFCRRQHRVFPQQGPHPVGPHFGRRMQPTEGPHAGEAARQDVLQKAAHPDEGIEQDRSGLAGFAVTIVPTHLAVGPDEHGFIAGGALEHVTGQVTQGVLARTGRLTAHVPLSAPDLGGDLVEQVGLFLREAGLKQVAAAVGEGAVVEQELFGGHPAATVVAQAATGNEVMNMRMINERARPGVEDTKHAQLGVEPPGIGGQVLQRLGADGKEQVQRDLLVRPDEAPQFLRHGERHQKVRHGQEQAHPLALQPVVGVGLPAERTMPVVAGMIAVVKAGTARTLEQFAAHGRSAAGQDLAQDLAVPLGHGRAESFQVCGSQLPEQLVYCETNTTVAGGDGPHRLLMNSLSRC